MASKPLLRVELVNHKEQRYATAGDWLFDADGSIIVRVSDTGNWLDAMLVAVHEIVEVILCEVNGVKLEDVDAFDMAFSGDGEPGEHPNAPYFNEHATANIVEQLVALQARQKFHEYAARIDALFLT